MSIFLKLRCAALICFYFWILPCACAYGYGADFGLGLSLGLGVSGFSGHRALSSPAFDGYAIVPGPAFSGGAGVTAAFRANGVLTAAAEAQYSWYRAGGEFRGRAAGVDLHSLELPVFARFGFGRVYAETGVQAGVNLEARVYAGGYSESPKFNRFAAGTVLGFGVAVKDGFTIGLRGCYGLLGYDKNFNGYPWSARVSATKFFIY
jgi:hypothetical protein